ncbi:right-handed parallel beta-helix repeat-containing protein [Microvirga zambiensis]|uniref:right-handed parallel beta-helix repeat-containing protein n=1 Tax=Microvirga zambiensis TaxID=1402137 RepID=UPI00191F2FB8|nr:right-handed parallel beta-helix repeat-containing protein [Microvirga zambiensis]
MMIGKTRVALIVAMTALQSMPALATTLYVSSAGDDKNPGTVALPFRSISKAAEEAKPGSRVTVLGGVYKEVVVIPSGGTAELPVTIEPASGEEVIIDGAGSPPDTNLVQINASYVTFRGFTVRNATRGGIAAWGVHDVEISDNRIQGSQKAGIWIGHTEAGHSYANVIARNEVWNNCLEYKSRAIDGGWPQGISLQASDKSTVIGNRVYRNYGEGIGTLSTKGVQILGNDVFDNYSVNIYLDNAPSTVVQENKVYHTYAKDFYRYGKPAVGIMIANEYTEIELPSRDINVTRNTLAGVGRVVYGDYQRASGLINSEINLNTVTDNPEPLWQGQKPN